MAHRARDRIDNNHQQAQAASHKIKTSIRISPDTWERVKEASRLWALSNHISPEGRVSMWVEMVLAEAAATNTER